MKTIAAVLEPLKIQALTIPKLKRILRPKRKVRNKHPCFWFRRLNYSGMHTFFGYYDRTPWSPSGDRLLLCATPINGRLVEHGDLLTILYYDLVQGSFKEVTQSSAWNYQQGAQQQWMNDATIIYNDVHEQRYVAKSICLHEGEPVVELNSPIAAYHQGRNIGISIDFERLRLLESHYGYPLLGESPQSLDRMLNQDVSIKLLDFNCKTPRTILAFDDLARVFPRGIEFDNYYFWINHPKFNPSGSKILFVVRSRLKSDHQEGGYMADLFVLDLQNEEISCVFDYDHWSRGGDHPFWRGGHHPIWYDDNHILMNWRVDTRMRYVLFRDISEGYRVIAPPLEATGHPTVDSTKQFLLTDDYPRDGYRQLKVISLSTGREILLGEFYSPPEFKNEWSCDLHPRWKDGELEICFDSAHEGKRSTYLARLTDEILNDLHTRGKSGGYGS